jgi:hypothetical protein
MVLMPTDLVWGQKSEGPWRLDRGDTLTDEDGGPHRAQQSPMRCSTLLFLVTLAWWCGGVEVQPQVSCILFVSASTSFYPPSACAIQISPRYGAHLQVGHADWGLTCPYRHDLYSFLSQASRDVSLYALWLLDLEYFKKPAISDNGDKAQCI